MVSELPPLSNIIHQPNTMIFEEEDVELSDVDLRIAKELMSRRPERQFKLIDKRPGKIQSYSLFFLFY